SQQLANPLASLISVPLQNNFDFKAAPNKDGFAYGLNIQPVIPFSLNDEWNLISRTIIPTAYRDHMPGGRLSDLGDINAIFLLSPTIPGRGCMISGDSPVFLLPTAIDEYLGSCNLWLGPAAVALAVEKAWTVGALGDPVRSVGGPSGCGDVSAS